MQLFKVTDRVAGSINGGTFKYPLPTKSRPGAWTPNVTNVSACVRGYHLTRTPARWFGSTASRIFTAEGRGAIDISLPDKAAFASVRLVEEVTPEWPLLPLYPELRLLLRIAWRRENGPDAQWPEWANLTWAYLSGANLSGADLSGANLTWADLSRADLSGAYLSGANLTWANLSRADLSRADLSRADLSGADLSGANLSGANLTGANRPTWLAAEWTVDAYGYIQCVTATVAK